MVSSVKKEVDFNGDSIWILTAHTDLSGTWRYRFRTNEQAILMYHWLSYGCIVSRRKLKRLIGGDNPALWKGERIDK